MRTIIVYYTFGGATKKEAERLRSELGADLCRVREVRNRSLLGSFIPGCPQAMKRKKSAIRPLDQDLNAYDRIVVGCPIWAAHPAPAFNAIVDLLPPGKEVALFFCSGGGNSQESEQGTKALIEKKGCTLLSYRDVNTGEKPGKMRE